MANVVFGVKPPPTEPVTPESHDSFTAPGAGWFVAAASRIGTSHVDAGTVREDAFQLDVAEIDGSLAFVIAVADGVGSASHAWLGARRACDAFVRAVKDLQVSGRQRASSLDVVSAAAKESVRAVAQAATEANLSPRDLATTLLGLLITVTADNRLHVSAFQAGNGLIAVSNRSDELEPLFNPGDELEDGSIHALTSSHILTRWTEHLHAATLADDCRGLIVATDGISDDLIPLKRNGPILMRALDGLYDAGESPSTRLLELIAYSRRGSTDDRTLACVLRRPAQASFETVGSREEGTAP